MTNQIFINQFNTECLLFTIYGILIFVGVLDQCLYVVWNIVEEPIKLITIIQIWLRDS